MAPASVPEATTAHAEPPAPAAAHALTGYRAAGVNGPPPDAPMFYAGTSRTGQGVRVGPAMIGPTQLIQAVQPPSPHARHQLAVAWQAAPTAAARERAIAHVVEQCWPNGWLVDLTAAELVLEGDRLRVVGHDGRERFAMRLDPADIAPAQRYLAARIDPTLPAPSTPPPLLPWRARHGATVRRMLAVAGLMALVAVMLPAVAIVAAVGAVLAMILLYVAAVASGPRWPGRGW